jgi:hypothetical protein
LYFRHLLIEYNKLFNGQMEQWVAAGGPEVLVGQALEISKRRSSRLAAAHHHLRRVARRNALRLQQQQQQRVTKGAAAATTTSSSSGSSRGHLAVALQEAGTLNSHSSSGTHRYVAFSA